MASVAPRPHPGCWLLPQVPHYVVQCPVLWCLDHACSGTYVVRGSPVPVYRPRRPSASAKPTTYGAIHAAGWGYGEDAPLDAAAALAMGGAFCTRSRRAGMVLQPRGTSHSLLSELRRSHKRTTPGPKSHGDDVHSLLLRRKYLLWRCVLCVHTKTQPRTQDAQASADRREGRDSNDSQKERDGFKLGAIDLWAYPLQETSSINK